MKIKIICVGKIKEKFMVQAIDEYAKRLSRFCNFEVCELNDAKIPDKPSESECRMVKESEGEAILKHISKDSFVISLCVEGKSLSSEEFADKIANIALSGKSTIDFIIGGSLGLSDAVKKRSDYRLSFSSFTFPHQLMRLILSEQIYRAFKINANEEYHK
jgi:23S rRNA (pseudouridine1915-N3)-methyltransferase